MCADLKIVWLAPHTCFKRLASLERLWASEQEPGKSHIVCLTQYHVSDRHAIPPSLVPSRVASHPFLGDRGRSFKVGKTHTRYYVRNISHAIAMQFTIRGPKDVNEHSLLVPRGSSYSVFRFCNHSCLHYRIPEKWIKVSSERRSCSSLDPRGSTSGKVILDIKTASKEACLFLHCR